MPRLQRRHPAIDNSTVNSFPVVFFNGEREIDLGNINVHPSVEFKKFQSFLNRNLALSDLCLAYLTEIVKVTA
uniref:DUF7138 domain-containing protein n=1 Tax=Nelumbo nucifera TaxID=4432 RepID=A0A822XWH3_NELNU|nr:TPA_asm: hypothetical protein HUJ06_024922 [Nelumbo nucifera]